MSTTTTPQHDHRPAGRTPRTGGSGAVAGIVGCGLGIGYAVFVRFYQGAGGLGFGVAERFPEPVRMASFQAGVLILLGAAACLVLTRPELRQPRWWFRGQRGPEVPRAVMIMICAVPAIAGGVFAIGHGAGGGLAKALELAGFGTASVFEDSQPAATPLLLWNIGFYGPWFLAMGLCLVLSALGYLRQSGFGARTVGWIGRLLAGLAVVSTVLFLLAMMLHWEWTVT